MAREDISRLKELGELEGVVLPLVTPFTSEDHVDCEAMKRLIDYALAQGVDALMPTALTGEGPLLLPEETLRVWDVVFERVGEAAPVVPAIISTTTQMAISLVQEAEARGAFAVMVAPILPELYAGRSHGDVYAFYADVATATELPIILFNYPSLTGVDFVPALVKRLSEIENVRYIKESTGDARRVHGIQRLVGDRISVICGAPNTALESLALGCRTWITGVMNVVPRSAKQLMRAVLEMADLKLARRIYYRQILPLVDIMLETNIPTGTIKAGVCARGVNVGLPRRPGSGLAVEVQRRLESVVASITQAEAAVDGLIR